MMIVVAKAKHLCIDALCIRTYLGSNSLKHEEMPTHPPTYNSASMCKMRLIKLDPCDSIFAKFGIS